MHHAYVAMGESSGVQGIRRQSRACAELGSPMYALLADRMAEDVVAGGVIAEVLGRWLDAPADDAVTLRLLGGVHRLVLQRRSAELAVWYPSVGGRVDVDDPSAAEGLWRAFETACAAHRETLSNGLSQPPQTNEVGRSAGLAGALRHLAAVALGPAEHGVRLFEIGASAGLNLRPDRVRVTSADSGDQVGPVDSPVVLRGGWSGIGPGAGRAVPPVIERAGCDRHPLDPSTVEDRITLTSYTWPDQRERLERLRGAFLLAAAEPVPVVHADAADWVRRVRPAEGAWTVLWHSVMWQYLSQQDRQRTSDVIGQLAARASGRAPVAEVSFEPSEADGGPGSGGGGFAVTVTTWTGSDPTTVQLGRAPGHGVPVSWGDQL